MLGREAMQTSFSELEYAAKKGRRGEIGFWLKSKRSLLGRFW
jgi:hypothetical protein